MTKITRIGDILSGTGVEREGDHLQVFHDLWQAVSAIESLKCIPVGQWVIDAFDDARREAGPAVDEPMDPMTAAEWLAPPAERRDGTLSIGLPSSVLSICPYGDTLLVSCEDGIYEVNPDGRYCKIAPEPPNG